MTVDSHEQMEVVMNAVMGHVVDSVVDLSSVIVILYQEMEISMLGETF